MSPVADRGWWRPEGLPGAAGAAFTLRTPGASRGPWAGFNLGDHVGDDPAAVAANRAAHASAIGAQPVYLHQVHGIDVVRLTGAATADGPAPTADAAVSTEPGLACTVLVADCLPVLFAAPAGQGVAAAHAGWRGLVGGVLEATVAALCEASACPPRDLAAWLGPCIGPSRFEVGDDVREAFAARGDEVGATRFAPDRRADGSACWRADLPRLARDRLHALGLTAVTGGSWCTVSDASRFFSFRRDGVTGRMAASVWC